MTTQSASAALSSQFTSEIITGFIPYRQGVIDPTTGSVKAVGNNRWGNLRGTTWATFKSYIRDFLPIKWTSNLVDIGQVDWFTLAISSEFSGTLSYIIYTSSTGRFTGEETILKVVDGDSNIPAFYGRYVYVTAFVTGQEFISMQITSSRATVEYFYRDVDTTTLSGTSSQRYLSLDNPISKITELTVTPQATSYAVDLYVSDTATSRVLIPVVISKASSGLYFTSGYITENYFSEGSQASFALYGIDNQPRDGVVDLHLKGLPRQVMAGGNLYAITQN